MDNPHFTADEKLWLEFLKNIKQHRNKPKVGIHFEIIFFGLFLDKHCFFIRLNRLETSISLPRQENRHRNF
jgi:flagellar biosynthesis regulator FlaF